MPRRPLTLSAQERAAGLRRLSPAVRSAFVTRYEALLAALETLFTGQPLYPSFA